MAVAGTISVIGPNTVLVTASRLVAAGTVHTKCGARMSGDFVDASKATVVDLLLTAHVIQRDYFDNLRVVEFGFAGVVECQVSVFANPQTDDVGGIRF